MPAEHVSPSLRQSFLALDDFVLKPIHMPGLVERLHRMQLRIDHLPDVITNLGQYAGRLRAESVARRMSVTIMFADVRGFTSISETRDPETVAAAVNSLLEHLSAAVMRFSTNSFYNDSKQRSRMRIPNPFLQCIAATFPNARTRIRAYSILNRVVDFRVRCIPAPVTARSARAWSKSTSVQYWMTSRNSFWRQQIRRESSVQSL